MDFHAVHAADRTPTLSGKAEPFASVIIYDNGEEVGDAATDANGNWSWTPVTGLKYGEHVFTAEAFDAAGNISAESKEWVLVIGNITRAAADDGGDMQAAAADAMLTLNLSQVLNEGSVNLFHEDGRTQMMVKGNAGDSINLDDLLDDGVTDLGDWAATGTGDKSRVQMMVKGNAGDKVSLSDLMNGDVDHGDWVRKLAVMVDGVAYDTYQHSSLGAELLVQQGVAVTVTNSTQVGVETTFDAEPVASTALPVEDAMLTLNLSQVLNDGSVNLFHEDGRTQMMVKGNAGDSINLDDLLDDGVTDLGDWAATGSQSVEGVAYTVYQHSGMDAELLVQEAVKVNLI